MTTSMLPPLLNALMAPPADNETVTWFGVGELVAFQLRFDDSGCTASAGKTVRKLVFARQIHTR